MSYQIIARKYRPASFRDLIGQDRAITIIKNSIERGKLGHAYLFSGPRGVGKTTLARILVKCLNCETGVTTEPCNRCSSCKGIQEGVSLDYEEIDGASNRGIDQIREINQSLGYASPQGKYRVFVIDEVHMLTTEAFNALLKSLEEPPPKILFVLCTTEKHRIPLTIRSRCQQFQLDRLPIHLIEEHLKKILDLEKINYEPQAIFPIAKKSDGSVRDGENLLEQAIAYCPEKIEAAAVSDILGELSSVRKFAFIDNLLEQRLKANQGLVHDLSLEGVNFEQFLFDLNEIFTAMIYYHSGVKEAKYLEFSEEDWQQVIRLTAGFKLEELFLIADLIYDFIKDLRTTTYERMSIYYFLIKLHRYKTLITAEALKENITHLAKYYLEPDENLDVNSNRSSAEEMEENKEKVKKIEEEVVKKTATVSNDLSQTNPINDASLKEEYKQWLEKLEEEDSDLCFLLQAFDFVEVSNEALVLYNRERIDEAKVYSELDKIVSYLAKLGDNKLGNKVQKIEIKKNTYDHNLKVVEKYLNNEEK